MIVKILGILDLITALFFFAGKIFSFFPDKLLIIAGVYLIVKGIIFILTGDIISFIDVFSGIIIVFYAFFNIGYVLFWIVLVFLVQKAIFSLIS